jgi:DNA polymerase
MSLHTLHRDIETHSTLDLPDVGAWRYAAEPNTGVWCVAYAVDDAPARIWTPDQPIPEEFVEAARNSDWLIAAHNDTFERAIEELILAPRFGWPIVPIERHRCTMAMVLASALPGSLDGAAGVLNSPFRKDAEDQRLMRKMARPRKPRAGEDPNGLYWHDGPENQARLRKYCAHDTEAERWLYQRVPPLTDSEQILWALDAVVNRRGFHTDGALEAASRLAAAAGLAVQEELRQITAGALISTDQVAALLLWLAERGCEVKNLRKPTLKHALRRKELDPVVRRVIELRLGAAHAAAAKIDTLLAWRGVDGRVRGTLRFHGAGTGRWTGHGPQPQNFKRDSEGIDAKLAAVATGDLAHVAKLYPQPLEAVGDIARAMICAAPGHRLFIGDFSGIESRVLAWVSGQQSKLEQWAKFDRTGDPKDEPYYILGRQCGQPEEVARKIGKTADLAFGYMGGPGAWDRLAPEDDTSSEADKRRYQRTWRSLHPQTTQFWANINRAAINAVRKPGTAFSCRQLTAVYDGETFLRITLPSGRSLSYPLPRMATDKFGNAMVMFKDNAAGKWVDCRYGQGAYGGLWTENIVQAVARDLLAAAMIRLDAAGYPVTLHVHDEIVCEVPTDFGSLEEFRELVTTLPDWAAGLPIAAKVRESDRFAKITKSENGNAAAASPECLGGAPEITHPRPPYEVESPANHCTPVENPPDSGNSAAGNSAAGNSAAGNSADSEHDPADTDTATGNAGDGNNADDGYASGEQPRGHSSAVYIYRDANSAPYLRVVRSSAKKFWQSHWDNGRWLKGKPSGPKIPYRLPELISAAPDIPVFVCEGEKDADNVAALGLIATTNSEGAGKGKWTVDLNKWFANKQTVYVLEDNDDDGRRHAREVAGHLQHLVNELHVVSFSELPPKGDVSDWLDLGGNKDLLLARAKAAPRWQRDGYILVRASDIVPRAMDWLWQGHILRGSQELLTGIPGNGKSQIHCAFVAYVTTGGAWPDGCNGAPAGNVIMMTAEDCLDQTIVPRLIAAGANRDRVFVLKKIRKDNRERMFLLSEDLEELERMIIKTGDVRLITIDPITAYMGGKLDSHRATDVRGQLGPLADLAERMDVALSAITHPPKHTTQRAIDHFIGSQAFIAAARIGHMAIEEISEDEHGNKLPTGRSLFTNPKNNVSRKMSTLAYRIVEKPLDGGIKAACVTWEEIVDITADQAVAAAAPAHKERGQQSDVIIFLMNLLANGPMAKTTIEDKATERGFSIDQLKRAKHRMEIVAFKQTGTMEGQWFWALAQHAPSKETDERAA